MHAPASDAATLIFNLPDYRVIAATNLSDGVRRIEAKSTSPPDCLLGECAHLLEHTSIRGDL